MNTHRLIRTNSSKLMLIPRLLAGLPLIGINAMHITGAAPLRPILEGANIPMPGVNAVVAPIAGLIAGLLLVSGAFARVGALVGLGSMSVAIYTHLVSDWADEPPIALPIVVLLASAWVLWKGAGAWSIDAHRSAPAVGGRAASA
jgi:uncharacterized membrane protein YphA (DoxX/SURF4 family)